MAITVKEKRSTSRKISVFLGVHLGMALAVSFNCQSLFSKVLKFLTLNA
jgi:hypothetical protein